MIDWGTEALDGTMRDVLGLPSLDEDLRRRVVASVPEHDRAMERIA